MNNIKSVFDEETPRLKVDLKFVREVHGYERRFVNSSESNITFLGGALMGTPRFIFPASLRHEFFEDILVVDDEAILANDLHSLPTVDKKHRVASDVFSLGLAYTTHKALSSTLAPKPKQEMAMDALRLMHYRFLSSLMVHYFPYEPDRGTMEATYAALNRKFSLKVYGSWNKLITARCEDILHPSRSIHIRTLNNFTNDKDIQYMITDTQGRIREVVKKMYKVFVEIHQNSSKVQTTKAMVDIDGELHVRDLIRKNNEYLRYIHQVATDKRSFIRDELVQIVVGMIPKLPDRHLVTILGYMSDNYGPRADKNVEPLIEETMMHAFEMLEEETGKINLAMLLAKLRSLYMSSRSTNPTLLRMRDLSMKIAKKAVKTSNTSLLASIRTAAMIYIVIRTLTMDYYINGGSMLSLESNNKLNKHIAENGYAKDLDVDDIHRDYKDQEPDDYYSLEDIDCTPL